MKFWAEVSVDTYWTRHTIIEANSWKEAKKLAGPHVDCIGLYSGLKNHGETPSIEDIPHLEGYHGNPGKIKYYNGAKPI